MTKQIRNVLKEYFETGKKPIGANYADLIDSSVNLSEENTGNIDIQGNITASGDISASGTIYADNFKSHGSTEIDITDSINVTGGVIASGDISSSATLLGTDLDLRSAGVIKATIDTSGNGTFVGTVQAEHLTSTDDATITDDLTVGGNISSSGTIHTDDLETGMGTMSVKGHMVPKTDYVYDLGSATHRWRDLHLNSSCAGCGPMWSAAGPKCLVCTSKHKLLFEFYKDYIE